MTDPDQFSGGCATSALTSNQWARVAQTREPDDLLFSAAVHLRNSAFHAAFPAARGWLRGTGRSRRAAVCSPAQRPTCSSPCRCCETQASRLGLRAQEWLFGTAPRLLPSAVRRRPCPSRCAQPPSWGWIEGERSTLTLSTAKPSICAARDYWSFWGHGVLMELGSAMPRSMGHCADNRATGAAHTPPSQRGPPAMAEIATPPAAPIAPPLRARCCAVVMWEQPARDTAARAMQMSFRQVTLRPPTIGGGRGTKPAMCRTNYLMNGKGETMRVADFSQAVTGWDLSGTRARRHSQANAHMAKLRTGNAACRCPCPGAAIVAGL